MATANLPPFKPSGNGLNIDLKNLKKAEILSAGAYRGQLIGYMDRIAGKTWYGGVRVYNKEINVNYYTHPSINTPYAKDLRAFFRHLGINDSGLMSMYNAYVQKGVKRVTFVWKKKFSINEADAYDMVARLQSLINSVSKIRIRHTNKFYESSIVDRPAVTNQSMYSGQWEKEDANFYGSFEDGNKRTYEVEYMMFYTEIEMLNSAGDVINDDFDGNILNGLKAALSIDGDKFATRLSLSKDGENEVYEDGTLIGYEINAIEEFAPIITQDWISKDGAVVTNKEYIVLKEQEFSYLDSIRIDELSPRVMNSFWKMAESIGNYGFASKRNLFIEPPPDWITYDEYGDIENTTRSNMYMSVDGLKYNDLNDIMKQISSYGTIDTESKKSSGFFGTIGNIIKGIFEAIVQIINAIANVLNYIPSIRIGTQLIAFVFSGEWTNDRKKLNMTMTRVVIAIIAVLIIIFTSGSGFQIAMSIIASAWGLYTGLQDYDEMMEQIKRNNSLSVTDQEVMKELLDLEENSSMKNDYDIYNFETHERISNVYRSPFDMDGLYNPVFGMG